MIDKEKLFNVLKNECLAILPSDTVYGIFADATSINAIKRIDEAKKTNKAHLILVSSISMLKKYVRKITPLQNKLIKKYWPGTLTILFEKSDLISDELTKGSLYVAIRMPNNKMLLDIIEEYKYPLISTSANISSKKVITSVDLIEPILKNKISYIYDGGCLGDISSTIVKVENNKIHFLREGVLADKIKNDFKDYVI